MDGENMSQEASGKNSPPVTLANTTVVIQGRVNPECIAHYASRYGPSCIISTWEGDEVDPMGMRIVRSVKPTDFGPQNSHLQIVSTLAGLRECSTEFVIKVRGDEYFSNLEYIVDELKRTPKILTLPIFFRPHDVLPFHPSDHLLAARKRQLMIMYKNALKRRNLKAWRWKEIPEQLLGVSYLEGAEGSRRLTKEHMRAHFDILDLNKVKDYRVCWNGRGMVFYNNFDPATDGIPSITSMDQL
jgi:hypothetical protein